MKIPNWLNFRTGLPVGLLTAAVVNLLLPQQMSALRHALITWEAGVLPYLLLTWLSMDAADTQRIRDFAKKQDIRGRGIFVLVVGAAGASLVALALLLIDAKSQSTPLVGIDIGLTVGAVFSSWLLTHTAYTVHYAHDYYRDEAAGSGLEFPGEKEPDYWDFAYFSFVIGMTFQVSDVQITSNPMRRLALVHSLLSFLFNTVILALSINLVAGLVK